MTALPSLSLDDLSYEDLRQMAMRRIPAVSGGRWTHHAPVDSGVTLLELFAFMLEQQLFVLDQVPDSLTHAILALLDDAPKPAEVARTIVGLAMDPGAAALPAATHLAAGTTVQPADGASRDMIFSIRDDTLLLPVWHQDVLVDDLSVSNRLERGEVVPVFSHWNGLGSLTVAADLTQPIQDADTGQNLALAMVLEGTGVPPEWDVDAATAPPPGPLNLTWSTPGDSGTIAEWSDGTGGLRRSGLVTFALPGAVAGADRLSVTLSADAAQHAAPPRLKSVAFGAAVIEHRERITIAEADTGDTRHDALRLALLVDATDLLPISSQALDLPATLNPAIRETLSLRLADATDTFHEWTVVPDLSAAKPEDRVCTFDRELGRLSFGDGYAARVPAPVTNIALACDRGGGNIGNHPAGMSWRTGAADPLFLVSLVAAEGGAEAETLEDARARAAASLGERFRVVTKDDYVALSENAPSIGPHRAHVVEGHDPNFPCLFISDSVTVFIVPRTEADVPAPIADDGALAVIRNRLDDARMLTTRVFVRRPVLRPVALNIEVASATGTPAEFRDLLRPVLSDYLHPAIGGPNGTGWPFGRPLRPSELLRIAEAVVPPGSRVERVAVQLTDTVDPEEDCTETDIGPTALVLLEQLSVSVTQNTLQEVTL